MARPKIVFISDQPGTSSAFAPLLARLDGFHFSELRLRSFWGQTPYSQPIEKASEAFAFIPTADLVITGTSNDLDFHREIWAECKRKKIPSIGYVEQWTNIPGRFTRDQTFSIMPDVVAVVDAPSAIALTQAGYDGAVKPVGHPKLEVLSMSKKIAPANKLIFVSEPYSELPSAQRTPEFTDDEHTFLDRLLNFIDGSPYEELVVRFHPREDKEKYKEALRRPNKKRITLSSGDDQHMDAGGIFIGLTSILLIEASVRGMPAASVLLDSEVARNSFLNFRKGFTHLKTYDEAHKWLRNPTTYLDMDFCTKSFERWERLIVATQKNTTPQR